MVDTVGTVKNEDIDLFVGEETRTQKAGFQRQRGKREGNEKRQGLSNRRYVHERIGGFIRRVCEKEVRKIPVIWGKDGKRPTVFRKSALTTRTGEVKPMRFPTGRKMRKNKCRGEG